MLLSVVASLFLISNSAQAETVSFCPKTDEKGQFVIPNAVPYYGETQVIGTLDKAKGVVSYRDKYGKSSYSCKLERAEVKQVAKEVYCKEFKGNVTIAKNGVAQDPGQNMDTDFCEEPWNVVVKNAKDMDISQSPKTGFKIDQKDAGWEYQLHFYKQGFNNYVEEISRLKLDMINSLDPANATKVGSPEEKQRLEDYGTEAARNIRQRIKAILLDQDDGGIYTGCGILDVALFPILGIPNMIIPCDADLKVHVLNERVEGFRTFKTRTREIIPLKVNLELEFDYQGVVDGMGTGDFITPPEMREFFMKAAKGEPMEE